jgi:hypothetical protein
LCYVIICLQNCINFLLNLCFMLLLYILTLPYFIVSISENINLCFMLMICGACRCFTLCMHVLSICLLCQTKPIRIFVMLQTISTNINISVHDKYPTLPHISENSCENVESAKQTLIILQMHF